MTGCLVTLHVEDDTPFDTQLGTFLEDNDLSSEQLSEMFRRFSRHEIYRDSGDLGGKWAIALSNSAPVDLLDMLYSL